VNALSIERLTTEEKQQLVESHKGPFAVVMGYLKAERGKIAPAVFNKIVTGMGFDRVKKADLVALGEEINNDPVLFSLYDKGYKREIKIDDVTEYLREAKVEAEKKFAETYGEEFDPDSIPASLKEKDLFAHITNFLIANEDNNARLRELRKLQREGVYMKILMENLKKYMVEELKGMPRAKYLQTPIEPLKKGDRSLVLLFSDWHVGALVYNEKTGGYNFKKLQHQVKEVQRYVLDLIDELDIKHVYVLHLGDQIEHISMRNVNQAFETEFPAAEQVAKTTRLIVDFLLTMSKHIHITYGMISGNHDRIQGNKHDKVYNDTFTYIIIDFLFLLQDTFGQLPNITLLDNREDTYELLLKVAGKSIKSVHGDHEKKKESVKIPKHIKEEVIDFLFFGHFHTTGMLQEDYGRFNVSSGSPMGANNFSKELNLPTTYAAQTAVILTEGSLTPWFIPMVFNNKGNL
jgi:predicted phosphodiesterase